MTELKYLQPLYFNYTEDLTQTLQGYVMGLPNLEHFKSAYGRPNENAPTESLVDTIRLLCPQIRVINFLWRSGQPNPDAFLSEQKIDPYDLSLILQSWVKVCYPEDQQETLLPLCDQKYFAWREVNAETFKFWSPSWRVATLLSEQEYQLGEYKFKLLFGTNKEGNKVELVSYPPFKNDLGYRASIAVILSTESDLDKKQINIHFSMKRWMVQQKKRSKKSGDYENCPIRLKSGVTHCYVRRLLPWSGKLKLFEPNSFTSIGAVNRKINEEFTAQWKQTKLLEILEKLSVNLPDVTTILENAEQFIETDKLDILIPAKSYQKAGWGTGVPFADQRLLLEQIVDKLSSVVSLSPPWHKFSLSKQPIKSEINQRLQTYPDKLIPRGFQKGFPEVTDETREFLAERIAYLRDNNLKIRVYYLTSEVKDALEKVAQHFFKYDLLEFHSSQGLANPISTEKKGNRSIPNPQAIKEFAEKHQVTQPIPVIVEIFDKDHLSYSNGQDPKPYLKSILPKYNLIPQCIVNKDDSQTSQDDDVESTTKGNIYNRALSAILDSLLVFDNDYPLSTEKDNTVYAGFYMIKRNRRTNFNNSSFSEPVLLVIYQNQVKVLLPARDIQWRSMSEAICYLAHNDNDSEKKSEKIINTMLSRLSSDYSQADDIYLFTHSQNARSYWKWLQDKNFDVNHPPNRKIHIIRIRDNYEVPQAYGLFKAEETFEKEAASFAQGIFLPSNYQVNDANFTQTVLSVSPKPQTSKSQIKTTSRFEAYTSEGKTKNPNTATHWKTPQPRAINILATPSLSEFYLHHGITHELRNRHWWTADEGKYPLPLALAEKLKEWCFNDEDM